MTLYFNTRELQKIDGQCGVFSIYSILFLTKCKSIEK